MSTLSEAAQALPVWTIYRTLHGPRHFAVRRSVVGGGRECARCVASLPHGTPEEPCGLADGMAVAVDSLELARAVVPLGLVRMPRNPMDDASIVEVWL
jgi:hypothetical protein